MEAERHSVGHLEAVPLAAVQRGIHAAKLEEYQRMHAASGDWPAGARLVLESGIGHEREWLRFWEGVAEEG